MFKDQLLNSWVFITNVAVSLSFAMILALLVEVPALNLDKILMGLLNRKTKDQEVKKAHNGVAALEKGGLDNNGFAKKNINE